MKFFVVKGKAAGRTSGRLEGVLEKALSPIKGCCCIIDGGDDFISRAESGQLMGGKIIFASELNESGMNLEYYKILSFLRSCGAADVNSKRPLKGAAAGLIADGQGELYTKDMARRLAFAANMAGCSFPGRPLVEATGNLYNFNIIAKNLGIDNYSAYERAVCDLIKKVAEFQMPACPKPRILMVHASSRATSNSLQLWYKVSEKLSEKAEIEEISLRNGQVWDCRGCRYDECLHFGEKSACFYGGVMTEKAYPAILRCDALVLVCPNYNDAVSANITAFINRLTALFRTNDFSRKRLYGVVVSGYSGGDIVSQQIIGALNMNKNFILPGNFAMVETANDPGSIFGVEGIEGRAKDFAENILKG